MGGSWETMGRFCVTGMGWNGTNQKSADSGGFREF
jgi:hypothetical protein